MIDWETGTITIGPGGVPGAALHGAQHWSLIAAGDWAALPGFVGEMLRAPTVPYGDLLGVIQDASLAMVNLETVLSVRGAPIAKDGPCLRGPVEAIQSLREAGFHVASLANNHARDYGREALEDTLALCRANGIRPVGAGLTVEEAWAPVYMDVRGVRVAILALGEHEEAALGGDGMDAGIAAWDLERAVAAVQRASREADLVIYQCHVGTEFNPLPAPRVQEGFHRLVDAGASLVIGHHPHVPLGIEEYHGGLIAYSLGNFLFDFGGNPIAARVHEGYLLGVELVGARVMGGSIYPYRAVAGHHLDWLRGTAAQDLLGHLERISRPLGEAGLLRESWEAFCDELFPQRWGQNLPQYLAQLGDDSQTGRKAGARLRNALRCEAHWDTLQTALNRIAEGQAGRARPEVLAEVRALNPWIRNH